MTQTTCYEIRNWKQHFENAESRKYKNLTWVPVKNKHDGKGYRRVCKLPNAAEIFAAWMLIVEVASKTPVRGVLADEDGPLTADDLADMTGFSTSIFENAFKALSDKNIGWIEVKNLLASPEISGDFPGLEKSPLESSGVSGDTTVTQNRTEQNRKGEGEEPPRAAEVPTEEEALEQTMGAGIPADFARYVFLDWSSRAGRDAAGNVVPWLPYVTKRWTREQVEWKAGTHRGCKGSPGKAARSGPSMFEVRAEVMGKHAGEPQAENWACSFFRYWSDPKRNWTKDGRLVDWRIELSQQIAKWRTA